MLAVGGWLLVLGVCDLLRAARDTTTWTRRALVAGLGVVLLVALGVALELALSDWVGLGGVMLLSLVGWVLTSSAALEQGPGASVVVRSLAGQFTAAAVVVAAEGLLRFPELQRGVSAEARTPDGPSDVPEYFLIGSFASWLVALAGVALLLL